MPELKSTQQERFAQAVVNGMNQREAYEHAGYKSKRADARMNASRLAKTPAVKARIKELRAASFDKYEITNDRIMRELALSAFARMKDYAAILDSGDLEHVTSEESAAITELVRDRIGSVTTRTRIKLGNKQSALEALAKIAGLMKEQPANTAHVTFHIEWAKRP